MRGGTVMAVPATLAYLTTVVLTRSYGGQDPGTFLAQLQAVWSESP